MNKVQSKKELIIKCISIIIGMALLLFAFFWVLITLSKLDQFILIALIAVIWFLFIYLGANLLMVMTQMHSVSYEVNLKNDVIEKKTAKSVLANEIKEELIKDGFEKIELTGCENFHNNEMWYLQRIKYNKGMYIDEFFIFKDVVSLEQVMKLFDEVSKKSKIKYAKKRMSVIRQKCIFVCVFCNNKNDVDFIKFIKNFDYIFSIFVPVFIDTEEGEMYYYKIPNNQRLAKGKALDNSQQLVLKYLCK